MSSENTSSSDKPSTPAPGPRLGIGTIVRHFQFGTGRVVAYEPGQYVIVFRGGDTRRVAYAFDGLEVQEKKGDPETDRIRQAVREVLGVELVERVTGAEGAEAVAEQRCVDVLTGGEVHLVPGVPGGDRERDQRVGVADRGEAGEEDAHPNRSPR